VTLGVVLFTLTQGAQFVAIDNQPAATTSLMLCPTAFLVAVFSARSLSERASPRQFAGAALVIVGAVVYFAGDLGATVVGVVAATVGLLANVAGSLLGRSTNRGSALSPVVVTSVSMTVGALLLLARRAGDRGMAQCVPQAGRDHRLAGDREYRPCVHALELVAAASGRGRVGDDQQHDVDPDRRARLGIPRGNPGHSRCRRDRDRVLGSVSHNNACRNNHRQQAFGGYNGYRTLYRNVGAGDYGLALNIGVSKGDAANLAAVTLTLSS